MPPGSVARACELGLPRPRQRGAESASGGATPGDGSRSRILPSGKELSILILEDNEVDADLEASILREAGYACCCERVQTREEFVSRISSIEYHLILADFSLPAFDGLSALQVVRSRGIDTPFILVSGTVGEETAIESLKAGATDYVLKSRISRLVPVIDRALQEREEHRQRQQAEKALRASEAKLRLATTQMPAALWTTDTELRLTSWVGAATPGTEEDLMRWTDRIPAEFPESAAADIGALAAHRQAMQGQSTSYEQRIDQRVFEVRVEPLRDADDRIIGCLALAVDISERKRAEDEIHRLNAQLEQRVDERTAQLEASNRELEAFSYSVSHDLRAPLRVIESFTKAILEEYASVLEPQALHYLDRVCAATDRTKQLVGDLLQLSRVNRGDMQIQSVDFSKLAHAVAADLQQAEPARSATFVIAEEVVANGDARLLRDLLDNLFANAWKFTSKHPMARIEFGVIQGAGAGGQGPGEAATSPHPPALNPDELVYFVRDDGAGFDPRFKDQLFHPFKRLHGSGEFPGTGIGLATVQRIVHRHGGRIWAEGAIEAGATFYFTLAPPQACITIKPDL